jgi:Macro domain
MLSVQDEKWLKKGVAVTSGGKLKCKYIFHVVIHESGWTDGIKVCLQEAENRELASISFPLLGTGISIVVYCWDRTWISLVSVWWNVLTSVEQCLDSSLGYGILEQEVLVSYLEKQLLLWQNSYLKFHLISMSYDAAEWNPVVGLGSSYH